MGVAASLGFRSWGVDGVDSAHGYARVRVRVLALGVPPLVSSSGACASWARRLVRSSARPSFVWIAFGGLTVLFPLHCQMMDVTSMHNRKVFCFRWAIEVLGLVFVFVFIAMLAFGCTLICLIKVLFRFFASGEIFAQSLSIRENLKT